ncbi:hypothetical protein ONZ45_g11050 [Pleurotus djamor]|nr:hypothetical protein ONZ45_g11050 [Pleurotus djamor]
MHSPLLRNAIKDGIGSTLRNPLKIALGSELHFQKVLWVFYDETLERITDAQGWLSILLTAEALEMEYVVNFAAHKLSGLPAPEFDEITLILIQDRYHIGEDWAVEAYCSLCRRREPLSTKEVERLGSRLTALIARAREAVVTTVAGQNEVVKDILDKFGTTSVHPPPAQRLLKMPPACEESLQRGGMTIESSFHFHRHFLITHSPLILGPKVEGVADTTSKAPPLLLGDVEEEELADLERLFYDIAFPVRASAEQWVRLRGIAQKFSMNFVGAFATKQLGDKLSLIERVSSLQRFKITGDWADEVMEAVYNRDGLPYVEEASELGYALLIQIWREREGRLKTEFAKLSARGLAKKVDHKELMEFPPPPAQSPPGSPIPSPEPEPEPSFGYGWGSTVPGSAFGSSLGVSSTSKSKKKKQNGLAH